MSDERQRREGDISNTRSRALKRRARSSRALSGNAYGLVDDSDLQDPVFIRETEFAKARRAFYRTLALVRSALNLTQGEVAERMGTTQSAVSDIEKGLSDPRLSTMQWFAYSLGLEFRFHLGTRWFAIFSWHDREIAYGSKAIHQLTARTGDSLNLWVAVLDEFVRHDTTGSRDGRYATLCSIDWREVKPVEIHVTDENRFITESDLRQLYMSHAGTGAD